MAGHGRAALRTLARVGAPLAVFGVTVALGSSPAVADPGNGNGNGNGNGAAASHSTNGTGGTFGSPTSSQPLQQPDNQGQGANTFPGPYSSTRDGSPSLNGNGDGLGVGQPCAGCVGKADNKNPPGQFPNGSDPNAGYECDRNNGIGKTNPAHTGCAATTPTPVPVKRGAELVNTVSVPGVGASLPVPSMSLPGALAFTGSSVSVLLFLGLASLAAGGALLLLLRLRFRGA
jgi:hypothetical protein